MARIERQMLTQNQIMKDNFAATFLRDRNNTYLPNIAEKMFQDGSRYEGQLVEGRRIGKGLYSYRNGDVYLGDWADDKFWEELKRRLPLINWRQIRLNKQARTVMLGKPGMAINSADFRNPWTPGNTNGSQDAAINTARLVDVAPKLSAIYTDSGNTISQVYKQILDGVCIPAQPPNPAIEKQLTDADAVLYRVVDMIDPDTGASVPKRIETQLYRDYLDNQAAYNAARIGYIGAYLEAQKTTSGKNTWPLIATTLQLPVRQAYDRWRSGGADRVEQAMAIINTSSQNALQKAFDQAKKTFEGYGVALDDSGTGMSTPIQRSSLLPSNWHSTSSTGWTTYDSASGSTSISNTSDYTSYGGSAGFSLGLFSIGGSAGHSTQSQHASAETNNLRISFSYTLVTIRRPWLTYNLLGTKGWNLGNLYSKGKISNGGKSGQSVPVGVGQPSLKIDAITVGGAG